MTITQWVNLEKEDDYAKDPDIGSKDRCGNLTIKTAFAKGNVPLSYKVKVKSAGSGNVTYTAAELARNSKFKMTKGVLDLGSSTEVLMEDNIQLPAAGGNKYILEAIDANGKTVSSVEVETKRRLYYQEITMDDVNGTVPNYSLSPMEAHAEKHFIYLKKMGATKKTPYFKTLTDNNSLNFATQVKKAYDLSQALQKVGIALVFSDYITDPDKFDFIDVLPIGGSNPYISISATDITISVDDYLWYGLDDADDKAKNYFVSGQLQHIDPINSPTPSVSTILKKDVDIAGTKLKTHGGYHKISIKRTPSINDLLNKTSGVLTFSLELNSAPFWTNGFSWNPWSDDFKLITVSRRPLWEDMTSSTREQVWNHELGHRLGMTSYGNKKDYKGKDIDGFKKLPDGPTSFYYDISDNKNYGGHRGPHCGKGAVYNDTTDDWSGVPGCVMYGADAIGSNSTPKEYCPDCTPIVRKLDLS